MEAEIKRVCDEMAEFLIGKSRSYGNSVAAPMGVFAKRADTLLQIDVRIDDKLSRLKKGADYPGDDTIKDLVGYLILRMVVSEQVVSGFDAQKHGGLHAMPPGTAGAVAGAGFVTAAGDVIAVDDGGALKVATGQKGDWRPWGQSTAFPLGVLANDRVTVVTEEGTTSGSAASVYWGSVIKWQFTWENVESIMGDGSRIVEAQDGRVGPKVYFLGGALVRPYTGVVSNTVVAARPQLLLDERDWFGRRPRDVWQCANGYYWNLDAYHRRKTCSN